MDESYFAALLRLFRAPRRPRPDPNREAESGLNAQPLDFSLAGAVTIGSPADLSAASPECDQVPSPRNAPQFLRLHADSDARGVRGGIARLENGARNRVPTKASTSSTSSTMATVDQLHDDASRAEFTLDGFASPVHFGWFKPA